MRLIEITLPLCGQSQLMASALPKSGWGGGGGGGKTLKKL